MSMLPIYSQVFFFTKNFNLGILRIVPLALVNYAHHEFPVKYILLRLWLAAAS